ncbi:uncharacterized protein PV09_08388 [Verruconis gallopava]|uniref:Uncharacterized protein n=1 Tax=Verruconis gallopava TaxID=253628 RepID=A0A0D1XCT4_9PEZI|nr:uncharacterized protein PV09_08388 [Verruconis gallopava]KIW00036.1 hypothetical protein PV09_08388 [Verruconis gallopava]
MEIRCQIYRELLVSDAEWIRPVPPWVARMIPKFPKATMIRPWPHPSKSPDEHEHVFESTIMDTSLFLACKQIYQESLPVLLEENPVVLVVRTGETIENERRINCVLKYARVLALKVEFLGADFLRCHYIVASWIRTLQNRTNIRTFRLRFMYRRDKLVDAWRLGQLEPFAKIKDELIKIKACAVATVECNVDDWFRSHSFASDNDPAVRKVKDLASWLEKDLAAVMKKEGCSCSKRADGRHVDRVEIGKGGEEPATIRANLAE